MPELAALLIILLAVVVYVPPELPAWVHGLALGTAWLVVWPIGHSLLAAHMAARDG